MHVHIVHLRKIVMAVAHLQRLQLGAFNLRRMRPGAVSPTRRAAFHLHRALAPIDDQRRRRSRQDRLRARGLAGFQNITHGFPQTRLVKKPVKRRNPRRQNQRHNCHHHHDLNQRERADKRSAESIPRVPKRPSSPIRHSDFVIRKSPTQTQQITAAPHRSAGCQPAVSQAASLRGEIEFLASHSHHCPPPVELLILAISLNSGSMTLSNRNPTTSAIPTIKIGSIRFVITRKAICNSLSYVSATLDNAPGTSPVSSPIFTKSTINCGKIFDRASGCASVFPSVTASRVLPTASFTSVFGMICSVIFNAVNTGTPFCSSVASTR